jgi:hypothetical protein
MQAPDPHAKPHNSFVICQVAKVAEKQVTRIAANQVPEAERSQAANVSEKQAPKSSTTVFLPRIPSRSW